MASNLVIIFPLQLFVFVVVCFKTEWDYFAMQIAEPAVSVRLPYFVVVVRIALNCNSSTVNLFPLTRLKCFSSTVVN